MATIDDIRLAFQNILQRSGTEVSDAEINSYVSAVDSGALTLAQARAALINSPEGQDVQDVVRLYQTVFGRVPDRQGLNDQVDTLRGPATELDIANSFANSPEFTARFGGTAVNTAFINAVYQQVLGRAPAASEVQFYLDSGFSAGRIALAFSESPEFRSSVNTAVTSFLDAAGQGTAVYTGPLGGTGNVGTTFLLTTGADNIVGTAANDTINALVDATAANSTITAADQINGGAGTDTLNLTVTADNATLPAATISSVENFFIRDVSSAGGGSYDFVGIVGEQQVWNDRSTQDVTFANIGSGTIVGVRGNNSVANSATTASYEAAATAAVVAFDGGTKGTGAVTLTGAGITTATISSTGGANAAGTIDLAAAKSVTINATTALTTTGIATTAVDGTLTVSGAGAVSLGTLDSGFDTVNASANTGGLTVTLDAETDTKVTGGSGNDVITTGAALTTGSVDAGAGTDVLNVASTGHLATAAVGAKYTNFEVLRNSTASTLDASLVAGITAVQLNASGAGVSKLTAAQGTSVTNLVDNASATISLASATGTSDSVSIILKNTTATTSADLTDVRIAGVENLTVSSQSGSATDVNELSFNAATDKLTSLTLTGDKSITVNLANVTPTTVTAAGLTGTAALTVAGATSAATITGTANGDTFTAGTVTSGVVTYNGGAGNDTFNATAAQLGASNAFAGGEGTDTVNVSNTTGTITLSDTSFQQLTGVETLSFAATTGDVAVTTGGFFSSNFGSGVTVQATALSTGNFTFDATSASGVVKLTTSATGDSDQTITTGVAADVITVNAGTGAAVISAGGGNDTVSVTTTGTAVGDATVTGGLGKDAITFTAANTSTNSVIVVNVGAGESTKAAYDTVTGFDLADGTNVSSTLNFDGTAAVRADFTGSTVAGFSSAELTASSVNGVITFAGSSAAGLTLAQKIEAVDSLVNTDNATAAFIDNGNTYVFHDSATAGGDSLVELVGVTATSLVTTNATSSGALFIA